MSGTYILRKGHAELSDLVDGAEAKLSPGVANVYYVNGVTWSNGFAAGNDGNDGLSIDKPLHTITKALSLCTNEGNDAIILLDYWAATGETFPVSINKSVVHILGVGGHPLYPWVQVYSAAAACFDIVADQVKIENIGFTPVSTSACLTFDDNKKGAWIKGCLFNSGVSGIKLLSSDVAFGLAITDCIFVSALSVGGIDIDDDPAFTYIAGNYFDRLTGDCINITSGSFGVIKDNHFSLKSNGEGLAITLGASCARWHVTNNYATYGEATTTSPYDDAGTSTTNGWGLNYLNLTAITCV